MRVYDYKCQDCGTVKEHFVRNSEVRTVTCDCGGTADRILTAMNFNLPGNDPSFPTAYQQWGDRTEKRIKDADKKAKANGDY